VLPVPNVVEALNPRTVPQEGTPLEMGPITTAGGKNGSMKVEEHGSSGAVKVEVAAATKGRIGEPKPAVEPVKVQTLPGYDSRQSACHCLPLCLTSLEASSFLVDCSVQRGKALRHDGGDSLTWLSRCLSIDPLPICLTGVLQLALDLERSERHCW